MRVEDKTHPRDGPIPFSYRATGCAWFCAYTHAKAERAAAAALEDRNYHAFCPVFKKNTKINGYRTEVTRPLFERYIFVLFDPAYTRKGEIKKAAGIIDLLGHSGIPQPIPHDTVEALVFAQMAGAFDRTLAAAKPGSIVELMTGPLKGHFARLLQADTASQRVRVLFEMLGSEREMILKFNQVRIA